MKDSTAPTVGQQRRVQPCVSVRFTERELRVLMLYWPADVETMGDADANDPQNPVQPTGQSILNKLCRAMASIG